MSAKERAQHPAYDRAVVNEEHHAVVNPSVDRDKGVDQVRDVYIYVDRKTEEGLVVSAAKVVATRSALTHFDFIAPYGAAPIKTKDFAVIFAVPMDAKGVKLICRPSYAYAAEVMGSPFDYPLSSRRDENDSGMIFDQVLVPWENVFVYRDVKINEFSRYDRFATWPVNGTPRPA